MIHIAADTIAILIAMSSVTGFRSSSQRKMFDDLNGLISLNVLDLTLH